jgi:hypothetical protein
MGIYVDYGALGANSQAIVSAGADSVMIRCDIGVTKSSGDFQMNALYISAGSFRMSDSYFTYSVTGATTDTALVQSAVVQTGVLTTVILNNNEMTITSNDTNDFLVGFETTANVTGTALLANNVIDIEGASVGACGGLWLYGTGSGMVANQNRLTVNCDTLAYGIFIDSTAGGATIDTRHNEIIITSAGTAQSANVAAGDTWNSTFDKITAANGYSGAGTINFVSSQIDGEFTTTGNVGVGVTSPSAKLHVDQETAGAAIPVLYLDQAEGDAAGRSDALYPGGHDSMSIHDIVELIVLATQDENLFALEDDDTLLLLDESTQDDSECADEVWIEEDEG